MGRKNRKEVQKRMWLEPSNPDTFSAVAYSYNEKYDEGCLNLRLQDCNRHISFYFDDSLAGKRKMKKFRDFVNEAADLYLGEEDTDG